MKKNINYILSIDLFMRLFVLGGLFLVLISLLRYLPFVNIWAEIFVLAIFGGLFYSFGLFLFKIISIDEIKILIKRIF